MRHRRKLWGFRWVAYHFASLFPRQKRKKRLGDLHERIIVIIIKEKIITKELSALEKLWAMRWVAYPVAFLLFSPEEQEEWVGDLCEQIDKMERQQEPYPIILINILIIVKTLKLILTKIIKSIIDLLIAIRKINK